ncbi:MAG TPA: hypothetical protein DDW52_17850, partial [Planctomycetaceae bacterium]|nr:hypothetical protein [Planctomycetaceae bacterium]
GGFGDGGFGGGYGSESLERELERAVGNSMGLDSMAASARGAEPSAGTPAPLPEPAAMRAAGRAGSESANSLNLPDTNRMGQNSSLQENLPPSLADNSITDDQQLPLASTESASPESASPVSASPEIDSEAGVMNLAGNLPQLPMTEPLLPRGGGANQTIEKSVPGNAKLESDGIDAEASTLPGLPSAASGTPAISPSVEAGQGEEPTSKGESNPADIESLPPPESAMRSELPPQVETAAPDTGADPVQPSDASPSADPGTSNSSGALSRPETQSANSGAVADRPSEAMTDARETTRSRQNSPVEATLTDEEINALLPEPDFKPETPLAAGRHYVFQTDVWQLAEIEQTLTEIAPLMGLGRRRLPRNLPSAVASLRVEGNSIATLAREVAETLDGLKLVGKPSAARIDDSSTIVALASSVQVDAILRELSVARRQRLGAAWLRPGGTKPDRRAILIIQTVERQ